MNYNEVLEKVVYWAKEVGEIQKKAFLEGEVSFNSKTTSIDLVTIIDIESEKYIISQIKTNFPSHNILSEESNPVENNSDYTWVIDPLDGTVNFAHKLPIFCVSIALKYKNEGVLGVIYVPCLDECFTAIKGMGAYLNGKKLCIREFEKFENSLVATGFPYNRKTEKDNNLNYFNSMLTNVRGIRRTGAAAFDLACVAAGRLTGYWELGIKPWDMEAAAVMIRESGGNVIKIPNKRDVSIVAGSNKFCIEMLKVIENTK